jgi:hypothetical protein
MIRRDYILRLVQEMVQLLARVVSRRAAANTEQALSEINRALRQLNAGGEQGPRPRARGMDRSLPEA